MSYSDASEPPEPERPLGADRTAYHRHMLATHKKQRFTGVCMVCRVPSCPDWRDAFDRLARAGALMAAPDGTPME